VPVHPTGGSQLGAAAAAIKGIALSQQLIQCLLVAGRALALPDDRAVRVQAQAGQGGKLVFGRPGHAAITVDILDADQPLAAGMAGQQPAGHCGKQRAGVQRAGR